MKALGDAEELAAEKLNRIVCTILEDQRDTLQSLIEREGPDQDWVRDLAALETVIAYNRVPESRAKATPFVPDTHEYVFDVKLFAKVPIEGYSEVDARLKLADKMDGATVAIELDETEYLHYEAFMDGDADLLTIDGKENQ